MINFLAVVGALALFAIAVLFVYIVTASLRDAYRKSKRYKLRKRRIEREKRVKLVERMHHSAILSSNEARRMIQEAYDQEAADV